MTGAGVHGGGVDDELLEAEAGPNRVDAKGQTAAALATMAHDLPRLERELKEQQQALERRAAERAEQLQREREILRTANLSNAQLKVLSSWGRQFAVLVFPGAEICYSPRLSLLVLVLIPDGTCRHIIPQ